jgi:hypothetical protein
VFCDATGFLPGMHDTVQLTLVSVIVIVNLH